MLDKTQQVMMSSSRASRPAVCRLYQVFIDAKIDLLVYGEYCSNLPQAQARADKIAISELYRTHIERAEKTYNEGKFKLRELLTIPLQRVLKYHLLLRVRHAPLLVSARASLHSPALNASCRSSRSRLSRSTRRRKRRWPTAMPAEAPRSCRTRSSRASTARCMTWKTFLATSTKHVPLFDNTTILTLCLLHLHLQPSLML